MPPLRIDIAGRSLDAATLERLHSVVVDEDLQLPAAFTLRFYDDACTLTDGETFAIGAAVTIACGSANQPGPPLKLLDGEITGIELELSGQAPVLAVHGYDLMHRLHRGVRTRAFVEQTDRDVIGKIASDAGLTVRFGGGIGGTTHAHLMQVGQSDYAFIRQLARRNGYSIFWDDGVIRCEPPRIEPRRSVVKQWPDDLITFRTRLSAAGQVDAVEVRAWDMRAKRAVVGRAATMTRWHTTGAKRVAGELARSAFRRAAQTLVSERPMATQREAEAHAQAVLDEINGDSLRAEGACPGDPRIRAACQLTVRGGARRFNGTYTVTTVRHSYRAGEYRTTFGVNGRRPGDMLGTLAEDGRAARPLHGVVPAIVTSNDDPEGLGRVKLTFPWLDEALASGWARVAAPGAGKARGLLPLPEVNDEVLVACEHGDINRPYVVGGLWNGSDKHDIAQPVANGAVNRRVLRTRTGHTLTFDDASGAGHAAIEIKTGGGLRLLLSDGDRTIVLQSASHTITLSDGGSGAVTIESSGDLLFKAQGKLGLAGGGSRLELGPGGVKLESAANLTLQGAGQVALSGATTDVKASAMLTIQGSLVRIN